MQNAGSAAPFWAFCKPPPAVLRRSNAREKTNPLSPSGFARGGLRWHGPRDMFPVSILIVLFVLFSSLLCALVFLDDQASGTIEAAPERNVDLP